MKKILFGVAALGLLGLAGAGVGLKAQDTVEAKAISVGDTFYFEANNTWKNSYNGTDVFLWAHFYKDGGGATHDIRLAYSSGNIFYATWPNTDSLGVDGIMFARGNASAIQWGWNNETWGKSFEHISGGNNYFRQTTDGWYDKEQAGDRDITGRIEYRPDVASGKAYLRGSWAGGWADFSHEMTVDPGNANIYTIENVTLTEGSQIKVVTFGADHFASWHDAASLDGDSGATFVAPNITITKTGNYNLSINTSTKAYTLNVYEDLDLNAAVDFADDFKASMAKYCPVVGSDGEKGTSKLATEWEAFGTEYADLTAKAKGYLKTLEDGGKIEEFRERYDSILTDYYSYLSSYDFLDRAGVLSLSAKVASSKYETESNSNFVLGATVAVAAAVLLGGAVIIARKRRAE